MCPALPYITAFPAEPRCLILTKRRFSSDWCSNLQVGRWVGTDGGAARRLAVPYLKKALLQTQI